MNARTLLLAIAFVAALAEEASASDEPPPTPFPAPPFEAWVAVDDVYVMPRLGRFWPTIAALRYGDIVRVTRCTPDCADPNAWVELSPFGATRLAYLRATPRDARGEALAAAPDFTWARVERAGVVAHREPSLESPVVERFRRDDELAFRHDPTRLESGWLERPGGGFVRREAVRLLSASRFEGWQNPPSRFVFVRQPTELVAESGERRPVARYERFPLVGTRGASALVPGGALPRSALRFGRVRARPASVPAGARWVHVDLAEQVLTAYEGDRLVFATLVSTGRRHGSTRTGSFTIRRKLVYTEMRGGGRDPYRVEGVPWVLYFDGAVALHAAYWHDGFGTPRSHGCVNLSPADARRIFDFAPPELPPGWRSVDPDGLGVPTLHVVVDAH